MSTYTFRFGKLELVTSYDISIGTLTSARGITWDGTWFNVTDIVSDHIYRFNSEFSNDPGGGFTIPDISGNNSPTGICWDGTYFYVTDALDVAVYKYNSALTNLEATYDISAGGNDSPVGICWDGTYFYVTDAVDETVYKYNSDFSSEIATYDLSALGFGNDNVLNIEFDGTYFYVSDSDGYIYVYPSTFDSIIAKYNISDSNDDPWGICWDGTYLYIVDNLGDMVHKYAHPEKDITSNIDECIISHPVGSIPTAKIGLYNLTTPVGADDIITITGNLNSMRLHGEPIDGQYIYKGVEDFRNTVFGLLPTGWTDSSGGTCSAQIIDKFNGHAYVIQLYDDGDRAQCWDGFTAATAGTIEFWICSTDCTLETRVELTEETPTTRLQIMIDADQFQYDDGDGAGTPSWTNLFVPTDCTWYRVKIVFDCVTDTYALQVWNEAGVSQGAVTSKGFLNDGANVTRIYFTTQAGDDNYLYFIGGVGYSWGVNDGDGSAYTVGDNAELETTLSDTQIFEGRVLSKIDSYIGKYPMKSLSTELRENLPGTDAVPYEPDGYGPVANYSEEVLDEIIGNEAMDNVKAQFSDEIYRGTYNNKNDSNNATPFGWVDESDTGSSVYVDTDSLGSHKNYIRCFNFNGATQPMAKHYFEAQTFGTVEYWMRQEIDTENHVLYIMDDAGAAGPMISCVTGELKYFRDAAWQTLYAAFANDTWYRIRIDFECTTGGYMSLDQYKQNIYVYSTAGATLASVTNQSQRNNLVSLKFIYLLGQDADTNDAFYDAFGFSWDAGYTIGDNARILIDNFDIGKYKIDYALNGTLTVERCISQVSNLEEKIWVMSPDHKTIMFAGTHDSQITLADNDVQKVRPVEHVLRFNKIICKGGFSGGVQQEGSYEDTDASTTYNKRGLIRYYTDFTDSDTLDELAESIFNSISNNPILVKLEYFTTDNLYLLPGEFVTVPADTIQIQDNTTYLEEGNYIVLKNDYDAIRGLSRLTLSNGIIFMYTKGDMEEIASLAIQ